MQLMCVFTELIPGVWFQSSTSFRTEPVETVRKPLLTVWTRENICVVQYLFGSYIVDGVVLQRILNGREQNKKPVSLPMKKLNRYPLISSVLEAQSCLLFTWYFLKPSSTLGRGCEVWCRFGASSFPESSLLLRKRFLVTASPVAFKIWEPKIREEKKSK